MLVCLFVCLFGFDLFVCLFVCLPLPGLLGLMPIVLVLAALVPGSPAYLPACLRAWLAQLAGPMPSAMMFLGEFFGFAVLLDLLLRDCVGLMV